MNCRHFAVIFSCLLLFFTSCGKKDEVSPAVREYCESLRLAVEYVENNTFSSHYNELNRRLSVDHADDTTVLTDIDRKAIADSFDTLTRALVEHGINRAKPATADVDEIVATVNAEIDKALKQSKTLGDFIRKMNRN